MVDYPRYWAMKPTISSLGRTTCLGVGDDSMESDDRSYRARANPTKAFFVNMITRDITLEDSILDLIDNSVDGAWRSEGSLPMGLGRDASLSAYRISISTSPEGFSIKDNCGGMTLDNAANYAFSFGRRPSFNHEKYSIGVYGIGMKRAAFKLGKRIRIRSTYQDADGSRRAFAVPINVDDWLDDDDPPWDFEIINDQNLDENGVEIIVNDLIEGTKFAFDDPAFIQNLRRKIARDYSIYMNHGLKISVNEDRVTGLPIELRKGEKFVPVHIDYVDRVDDNQVTVKIIGGMAAPPPENVDPDEADDGDKRFGWYVACNSRIVLAADKTDVTGWGTLDWPQWHRQYSGFIGIVMFTAENATALPLTTTKRSVDVSSEIYLNARSKMHVISKDWIGYTNTRKNALEDAKANEIASTAVPIHDVKEQPSITLPNLSRVRADRPANVSYSVSKSRMKKLAKEFGNEKMSHRDVGLKSFDYTYDDLVEEG